MLFEREHIYSWFKTLDGSKRIQFLHGILHLCFPLELRFIGTCIEELARKDYNYLRDAEIKANTLNEVLSINDLSDRVQRSKLIVTLALLNSTNQECARIIYDLIKCDILDLVTSSKHEIDDKIADEYLLVLTMAANHPAFEFIMKTVISNQLKLVESKFNNDKQEQLVKQQHQEENDKKINDIENNNDFNGNNVKPINIKSINFEGVHSIEGTDKYKFVIKIDWSDNSVNHVGKTYSELCDFHKKLISKYSNELEGILNQNDIVLKEDQKEDFIKELPLVTEYCNKIVNLPEAISQSEFVINFFGNSNFNKNSKPGSIIENKSEKVIFDLNSPETTKKSTNSLIKQNDLVDSSKLNNDENNEKLNKIENDSESILSKSQIKHNDENLSINTNENVILDNKFNSYIIKENKPNHTLSSPCMSPTRSNQRSASPSVNLSLINKQQQQITSQNFNRSISPLAFTNPSVFANDHLNKNYQQKPTSSSIRMKQTKNRTISNQSDDFMLKNELQGNEELSSSLSRIEKNFQKSKGLIIENTTNMDNQKHNLQPLMINKYPYFIGQNDTQFTTYNINTMQPHPLSQPPGPYYSINPGTIPNTQFISPYPMTQSVRFYQVPLGPPIQLPLMQPPQQQQQQQTLQQPQELKTNVDSASSTESTSPASSQSPGLNQQQNTTCPKNKLTNNNENINASDDDRANNKEIRKNLKSAPNMVLNSNKQPQYSNNCTNNNNNNNSNTNDRGQMIPNYINNIRSTTPNYPQVSMPPPPPPPNHFIQQIPQTNIFYDANRNLYSNTPPPPPITLHPTSNQITSISTPENTGTSTPPLLPITLIPQQQNNINDLNVITNQKLINTMKQQQQPMSPNINMKNPKLGNSNETINKTSKQQQQRTNANKTTDPESTSASPSPNYNFSNINENNSIVNGGKQQNPSIQSFPAFVTTNTGGIPIQAAIFHPTNQQFIQQSFIDINTNEQIQTGVNNIYIPQPTVPPSSSSQNPNDGNNLVSTSTAPTTISIPSNFLTYQTNPSQCFNLIPIPGFTVLTPNNNNNNNNGNNQTNINNNNNNGNNNNNNNNTNGINNNSNNNNTVQQQAPPPQGPPFNLIPAYPPQHFMPNANYKYPPPPLGPHAFSTPNDLQFLTNQLIDTSFLNENTNINNNYLKNSHQKKKSCYNCGMSHMGSECREPTYDNMSSSSQFRLNYKPTNNNDSVTNKNQVNTSSKSNLASSKSSTTTVNNIQTNTINSSTSSTTTVVKSTNNQNEQKAS